MERLWQQDVAQIITKLSKFAIQEDIRNLTILSITQVTIGKLAI